MTPKFDNLINEMVFFLDEGKRDAPDYHSEFNPIGRKVVDTTKTTNLASPKLNWLKSQQPVTNLARTWRSEHERRAHERKTDRYVSEYIRANIDRFRKPEGGIDFPYVILFLINAGYNTAPKIAKLHSRTKGVGGILPKVGGTSDYKNQWVHSILRKLADEGIIVNHRASQSGRRASGHGWWEIR